MRTHTVQCCSVIAERDHLLVLICAGWADGGTGNDEAECADERVKIRPLIAQMKANQQNAEKHASRVFGIGCANA